MLKSFSLKMNLHSIVVSRVLSEHIIGLIKVKKATNKKIIK